MSPGNRLLIGGPRHTRSGIGTQSKLHDDFQSHEEPAIAVAAQWHRDIIEDASEGSSGSLAQEPLHLLPDLLKVFRAEALQAGNDCR